MTGIFFLWLLRNESHQNINSTFVPGENILLIPGLGTTKTFPQTATDGHRTHRGTRKQSHYRSGQTPRVPEEVEAPRFEDNRHMKVVRLSALRTGRLYPLPPFPRKYSWYSFLLRTAVAQWLRRCATNRKVAGSIPDGVIGIFH